MNELLPCPFCGYEALVQPTYDIDTNERDGFFAWCSNYDCECKPQTRDYLTEAEAIAAWNTRAERTCENNAPAYLDFLCSECGFVHYHSEANDTGEGNGWNYCPNCGAKVIGG